MQLNAGKVPVRAVGPMRPHASLSGGRRRRAVTGVDEWLCEGTT